MEQSNLEFDSLLTWIKHYYPQLQVADDINMCQDLGGQGSKWIKWDQIFKTRYEPYLHEAFVRYDKSSRGPVDDDRKVYLIEFSGSKIILHYEKQDNEIPKQFIYDVNDK